MSVCVHTVCDMSMYLKVKVCVCVLECVCVCVESLGKLGHMAVYSLRSHLKHCSIQGINHPDCWNTQDISALVFMHLWVHLHAHAPPHIHSHTHTHAHTFAWVCIFLLAHFGHYEDHTRSFAFTCPHTLCSLCVHMHSCVCVSACCVICILVYHNGATLQILASSSGPPCPLFLPHSLLFRFNAGSLMLSLLPYGGSIS